MPKFPDGGANPPRRGGGSSSPKAPPWRRPWWCETYILLASVRALWYQSARTLAKRCFNCGKQEQLKMSSQYHLVRRLIHSGTNWKLFSVPATIDLFAVRWPFTSFPTPLSKLTELVYLAYLFIYLGGLTCDLKQQHTAVYTYSNNASVRDQPRVDRLLRENCSCIYDVSMLSAFCGEQTSPFVIGSIITVIYFNAGAKHRRVSA